MKIDELKTTDTDLRLLLYADKLSNIKDMIFGYEQQGDNFWNRFNASKEKIACYYRSWCKEFYERHDGSSEQTLDNEFEICVEYLFHSENS